MDLRKRGNANRHRAVDSQPLADTTVSGENRLGADEIDPS